MVIIYDYAYNYSEKKQKIDDIKKNIRDAILVSFIVILRNGLYILTAKKTLLYGLGIIYVLVHIPNTTSYSPLEPLIAIMALWVHEIVVCIHVYTCYKVT